MSSPSRSNTRTPNNSNTNRIPTIRTPSNSTSTTRYNIKPTRNSAGINRYLIPGATNDAAATNKPVARRPMPRTDATTTTRSAPRRPITERYAPRDTVLKPAPSTSTSTSPRLSPGTPTARRRPVSDVVGPAVTGTTPNLVPRTSTPRLGAPRTANNRSYASSRYRWGNYSSCRSSIWNGYWGYGHSSLWGGYGYGSWCNTYAGLGCWGFDPLCWGMGLLSPYAAFRASYWNNCYRSCYWNNWSIPNALPANYWWYPTTTYCPTYLYVPSSVVIIEEEEVLEPADGSTAELSSYGTGSAAESAESTGDGIAATPASLAEQYVELGDYYFKNGDYGAAAEAYSKARNHMPEDASVHFVLADAVFANGDYHYAAFLIAEGVRLNPRIVGAEVDKREFYGDPKAFEQQLEALEAYCSKKPYDAWAQLVLGYNLRFSDRPTRAIAAFQRVLKLDRDNPTANVFLADLMPAPKADKATKKAADEEGAKKLVR